MTLQDKYIDILFVCALFLAVSASNFPLAGTELISPDASGYLDMGRNLFSGIGAVTSYNLNQYWPGKYYPFLPYIQPVYPVIAGIIWFLFSTVKSVIGFNILLLSVNCVFLYKILRLKAGQPASFLIALFMGFSPDAVFTAIYPWTEQLHLFFLLSAVFVYLRYKNAGFITGIILAISCLTRASGFYNVLAFVIAIAVLGGFSKGAVKRYLHIAAGFLLIFIPYELFCYIKYGVFYPEYLIAAKIYRSAEIYPGAFYNNSVPVLGMPPIKLDMAAILSNIDNNIRGSIGIFRGIKFALILAPVYAVFDMFKRRTPVVVILFFQGLCVLIAYIFGHAWSPVYEFSRFFMISFIALGSIGFLALEEIVTKLFPNMNSKSVQLSFIMIMCALLYVEANDYFLFRNYYKNVYPQEVKIYRESRDEIYDWIKGNAGKDDLVASDALADSFLHKRPFVSLPPGKAMNAKNMKDFLKIYKPAYVITYNEKTADFLKTAGFEEKKRSGILILLACVTP